MGTRRTHDAGIVYPVPQRAWCVSAGIIDPDSLPVENPKAMGVARGSRSISRLGSFPCVQNGPRMILVAQRLSRGGEGTLTAGVEELR